MMLLKTEGSYSLSVIKCVKKDLFLILRGSYYVFESDDIDEISLKFDALSTHNKKGASNGTIYY